MEEDIREIKENVRALRRRPVYVSRVGLYAMVFVTMVNSCDVKSTVRKEVRNLAPKVQTRNVIGNEKEDKFYDIDGRRAFVEIDGAPVENYLQNYKQDNF